MEKRDQPRASKREKRSAEKPRLVQNGIFRLNKRGLTWFAVDGVRRMNACTSDKCHAKGGVMTLLLVFNSCLQVLVVLRATVATSDLHRNAEVIHT